MYHVNPRPDVDKIFLKLAKKNPKQLQIIFKKIEEIIKDPHRYKNLRSPLNTWKRVHIDKHFVLAFSIDENSKTIIIEDYDHHDNVYG
ncbi:type II toxin-antitoxin system RelE/ParE family toxin [Nanoarchaeota archaeon]